MFKGLPTDTSSHYVPLPKHKHNYIRQFEKKKNAQNENMATLRTNKKIKAYAKCLRFWLLEGVLNFFQKVRQLAKVFNLAVPFPIMIKNIIHN